MMKASDEKERCLCQVPRIQRRLPPENHAKKKAQYLKLLAHPTRLQILKLLSEQDLCVCVFAETLGKSQPNISQHLARLKDNGIIDNYPKGKLVFYTLKDENIKKMLECVRM